MSPEPQDQLAPHASLHLARCSVEQTYPHHTEAVRKGNATDAILLARYREKQQQLRRIALEMAALELQLKERIAFNEGLEIPGEGILYWTSKASSRRTRTNWSKLVADLRISEAKLKTYQKAEEGRRFFFRRKVKSPAGHTNTTKGQQEEIAFDGEL